MLSNIEARDHVPSSWRAWVCSLFKDWCVDNVFLSSISCKPSPPLQGIRQTSLWWRKFYLLSSRLHWEGDCGNNPQLTNKKEKKIYITAIEFRCPLIQSIQWSPIKNITSIVFPIGPCHQQAVSYIFMKPSPIHHQGASQVAEGPGTIHYTLYTIHTTTRISEWWWLRERLISHTIYLRGGSYTPSYSNAPHSVSLHCIHASPHLASPRPCHATTATHP